MKPHTTLLLSLGVSAILSVSAQAGGGHHGNNGSPGHPVASAGGPPRSGAVTAYRGGNIRYSGNRMISPSTRLSSIQRNTAFNQRRFNNGTLNGNRNLGAVHNQRGFRSRTFANTNRSGASNRGVFARHLANQHPNWDRHRDHWWNGHRCRWVNNSWIIFDVGFLPWYGWPYDYYAYGSYYPYPYAYNYGYNDYGYDQSDQNVYQGEPVQEQPQLQEQSQPDYKDGAGNNYYNDSSTQGVDSTIAAVQQKLTRQGYYRGQIDGVLGPETRHALVRYQSNNGLRITGSLTPETLQALSRERVARY